jgi:hypothetical protein
MGLKLRIDGERIKGKVCLDRRQEGAPGIAHGRSPQFSTIRWAQCC